MDLDRLRQEIEKCTKCSLALTRKNVVVGEGSQQAALMFIGEGPGEQEDLQGKPFVGKAGQLLDKIIAAAGFSRDQIYICNIVKCRPPGNRLPSHDEVEACKPYLREQIRLIRPKLIVCLGALAAQTVISPEVRITRDRGRMVKKGSFLIMPTFHPAALLRDPAKKRPVWEDMLKVKEELARMLSQN